MDSGNLIYIIAFVIIIGVNIIKNIKKFNEEKELEQQERRMSGKTRDVISQSDDETVVIEHNPLDTLRKKLEDIIESQNSQPVVKENKTSKKKKQQPSTVFLATEEGASAIVDVHKSSRVMAPIEEEKIAPIELNLDDSDEIRRAFIYAEIFNRKY